MSKMLALLILFMSRRFQLVQQCIVSAVNSVSLGSSAPLTPSHLARIPEHDDEILGWHIERVPLDCSAMQMNNSEEVDVHHSTKARYPGMRATV
jgi:hypothetical protein